jgi:hypothetical protein
MIYYSEIDENDSELMNMIKEIDRDFIHMWLHDETTNIE